MHRRALQRQQGPPPPRRPLRREGSNTTRTSGLAIVHARSSLHPGLGPGPRWELADRLRPPAPVPRYRYLAAICHHHHQQRLTWQKLSVRPHLRPNPAQAGEVAKGLRNPDHSSGLKGSVRVRGVHLPFRHAYCASACRFGGGAKRDPCSARARRRGQDDADPGTERTGRATGRLGRRQGPHRPRPIWRPVVLFAHQRPGEPQSSSLASRDSGCG